MSSLNQELDKILLELTGQTAYGNMAVKHAKDRLQSALQTAVLAAVQVRIPPKPVADENNLTIEEMTQRAALEGFNAGLDQATKALQQLFESEG